MLADGSLNVSLVAKAIQTIQAGAALGKVVVVGLWPGPLVRFGPDGDPLWPEGSGATPRTPAEWRAALLSRHAFAIAFFLTVAEPLVYMQYMLWYNGFSQGALPCNDQPGTCCAPNSDSWYPDLYKPLGAPLGPAKREGNVWTRAFAHASSTLDLDNPGASGVAFNHLAASVDADAGDGAGVDAPAQSCDDVCLIACAEGAPTCMDVWSAPVPDRFTTRFTLQSGAAFDVHVESSHAPPMAARFYVLSRLAYFVGAPFYRVLRASNTSFVSQVGYVSQPCLGREWAHPFPHLQWDLAHRRHICTGTGAHRSPCLHRVWDHRCLTCGGAGLTAVTSSSARGFGSLGSPLPSSARVLRSAAATSASGDQPGSPILAGIVVCRPLTARGSRAGPATRRSPCCRRGTFAAR